MRLENYVTTYAHWSHIRNMFQLSLIGHHVHEYIVFLYVIVKKKTALWMY